MRFSNVIFFFSLKELTMDIELDVKDQEIIIEPKDTPLYSLVTLCEGTAKLLSQKGSVEESK